MYARPVYINLYCLRYKPNYITTTVYISKIFYDILCQNDENAARR